MIKKNFHPDLLIEARKSSLLLGASVLCGAAGGLLVVLQARRLASLITAVFLEGRGLPEVLPLLGTLLGIMLLRSAAVFAGELSSGAAAVRIRSDLRARLFEKIQRLGPLQASQERSGELVSTALQGVDALDAYFSQYLPQIALAAAVPVIILASVFPLDLLSAVILLLTAPLIPVFMILIGSMSEKLTRRQFTALSRMSAFFLDTLQGLTTLKALGQSRNQSRRIERASEDYRDTTLGVLRVTFLSALVLELVGTLSTAVIAVQIGLRLLYSQIGFEQAFFILVIAPEFYLPLRQLGLRFHAGMTGISAARRIFELLNRPDVLPLASTSTVQTGRPAAQPVSLHPPLHIVFDEVSYTYDRRGTEAVDRVSFQLSSGEQVALVGETGSGKSTVASLLMGFIAPDRGRIRVNGMEINRLPPEVWWQQISVVPQRPYLYRMSIEDNIRLACSSASTADVRRAVSLAGLDELLRSLPDGYDTVIGEQGVRLSGGQAQRLALARAFLRNAPLLILDEPTAHLDVEQEEQLLQAVRLLRAGRAVLVIAHRLPTVMEAACILVLHQGRVIEKGAHGELLQRGGRYAALLGAYRGTA